MRIRMIQTQYAISRLLSRPSSRRSHRSSTSTSSYSSSPLCPSPLSTSLSPDTVESESPNLIEEEDLTDMKFLEDHEDHGDHGDHEDIVSEDNGGVVGESLGTMDPEYYMEIVVFKVIIIFTTLVNKKHNPRNP